jgi:hypothetical protein
MNSISCDIVLLPEPKLAARAIAVSQQFGAQFDTLYTLEDGSCFPHMSLYMTQLKLDNIEQATALLAAIAKQSFALDLQSVRYYQSHGYIDAEYERPAALADLQMAVVNVINPIRDGLRESDKVRMLTNTGKLRENIEKYGYRGVGELFRPHVSFTRFADEMAIDLAGVQLPPPESFAGQFTRLGLFEMGENGECLREIAEFELESNP